MLTRKSKQVRIHVALRSLPLLAFAVFLRASALGSVGTFLSESSKSWLEQRKIVVQVLPHLLSRMLALGPVLLEEDLNEVQRIFVGLLELATIFGWVGLSDQLGRHLLDGIVDNIREVLAENE